MAQRVRRGPLTAEAEFAPGSSHVGCIVDKEALLRQVFLRVLLSLPVNVIPPLLSILIYHLGKEQ